MWLRDRVAIVREICLEFARAGRKVVVADIVEKPKRGKYHDQDVATTTAT